MKLSSRLLRRLVIAGIFLAVFSLTGLGIKTVVTPQPTCTDGIMNGEEEGIDCGLFACSNYCEPDLDPPQVISTKLIQAGPRYADRVSPEASAVAQGFGEASENDYDFVAEIKNPHQQFGASEVEYELTLFNGDDNELSKEGGIFYILPGQTKYLVLTHLTTERNVSKIDFKINSATWQRIDSLEGLSLIVRQDKYTDLGGSSGSILDAVILNDSDFDFEMVDIDVLLFNARGDVVAVNRSDIRTFLARTERSFRVIWPFNINGKVDRIEVFPSTNLFENSNFIKTYGSETEKFQEYKHLQVW